MWTIHADMLPTRHSTSISEIKQKRGYITGDPVCARDYRPNHRRIAAIVSKRRGSMVYEVEVGNEKWLRQNDQDLQGLLKPNVLSHYLHYWIPLSLLTLYLSDRLRKKSRLIPVGHPERIAQLRGNRRTARPGHTNQQSN